jgi:hypothetical protein
MLQIKIGGQMKRKAGAILVVATALFSYLAIRGEEPSPSPDTRTSAKVRNVQEDPVFQSQGIRPAAAPPVTLGSSSSASCATRLDAAGNDSEVAAQGSGAETAAHQKIKFSEVSTLSPKALANIDPLLHGVNTVYQIDMKAIQELEAGDQVTFQFQGKELQGKVSREISELEGNKKYVVVTLPDGGMLRLHRKHGHVGGRLKEGGYAYHIDGFNNEIALMDLFEYKLKKGALKHD